MEPSSISVIDMLNTLNAHAYEYDYSCGSEYVSQVVLGGSSKYSEDLSLYLYLRHAGVIN